MTGTLSPKTGRNFVFLFSFCKKICFVCVNYLSWGDGDFCHPREHFFSSCLLKSVAPIGVKMSGSSSGMPQ